MLYEYSCGACHHTFDVVKSADLYERPEYCEKCKQEATRLFRPKIYLSQTKVQEATYNPGLGCVVNNRQHQAEICKQRGLVEIGNDYSTSENLQKSFEKAREEKWEKSWAEADKGWIGNE